MKGSGIVLQFVLFLILCVHLNFALISLTGCFGSLEVFIPEAVVKY